MKTSILLILFAIMIMAAQAVRMRTLQGALNALELETQVMDPGPICGNKCYENNSPGALRDACFKTCFPQNQPTWS